MLQIKNTLGGGKPNAPYAWAKYEHASITPVVALTQVAVDNYYFYLNMSSNEIDVSTITKADLVGLQTTRVASNSVDTYWTFGESNVVKTIKGSTSTSSYSYEVSGGQIVISLGGTGGNTIGEWSSISLSTIESYNFIEYITDKSPTKYPNGEVHTDGYFYRYAPEGLYVWKKYNAKPSEIIVQENPSFTVDVVSSSSSSYVTITLNGDDEFLDRIDDSYFDGFTINPIGTQSWFRYTNGVLYLTASSTATTSNYKYHYDAKTHIITALQTGNYFGYTGSTSLSYSGTKTFELPILIGDFIDYIVSDKETAYPDGGVHTDGYWYEKVGGFLTGTITQTTKNKTTLSFEYGSNKTPKAFYLMHMGGVNSGNVSYLVYSTWYDESQGLNNGAYAYYSSPYIRYTQGTGSATCSATFSDGVVTLGGSNYYYGTYLWVAIF